MHSYSDISMDSYVSYEWYGLETEKDTIRTQNWTGHNSCFAFLTRSVFGGFLDNHDNQRFLNLNPSHTSLKNALAFLMMGDWIPIVYYGTEQGFNGGSDPYNRESLWPSLSTANPLYKFIQTLAKFRRSLGNEWIQDKQVTHMMKNRCSYLEVLPTCHLERFCLHCMRS